MNFKTASALIIAFILAGCTQGSRTETARQRIHRANLEVPAIFSVDETDSLLAADAGLPVGERVGRWARRFLTAPGIEYRFGPEEGGYVALGRIVMDERHDYVSFVYRCTELARSGSAAAAVDRALATRFAGADLDSLADGQGRVDYDRPEHLDFSLDMVHSGLWGRDVTGELSGAAWDLVGSARYAAGSFRYVPDESLAPGELAEGDVVWLVLDPGHPAGARLRREFGLVIGHLGLVILREGAPWLVHAASSELPGWYAAGGIVTVPLTVYLERVERFAGVIVTRLDDGGSER